MKFRHPLILVSYLFFFATGFAHAAVLVAADDNYGIPSDKVLQVEAPGVLSNDTLDGQNAGDNNAVTAVLVSGVSNGTLTCPDSPGVELCADGSFEYIPNPDFSGTDSFTYQAAFGVDVSAPATVTLSACNGGPAIFTCWHETPYRAKLAELGYNNLFIESFEGTVWNSVRSSFSVSNVAPGILSKGITWTSNHPGTNNITTGSGPARTGLWGGYDPEHGFATGTFAECDIDNPPIHCRPHDGLSGKIQPGGDKLHGIGGYISGFTNASIAIILDGTPHNVGTLPGAGHHFFGVIDATGFNGFEFQELGGKVGQEKYIFGDDFLIASSGLVDVNNPPVLTLLDERFVPSEPVVSPLTVNENEWLSILLTAADPNDGDSWSFSMTDGPVGSSLIDNFDGTATFFWIPDFNQAGDHTLTFTVTDNGIPVASVSEVITITVVDVNRSPVLSPIGNKSVTENMQLSILLTASDPEGNALSFAVDTIPSGSSFIDNNDGTATFSWTPVFGQAGSYSLNFTVSDNGVPVASDSEAVTITVVSIITDVTPPVVTAPANITVAATDANGTTASVAAITSFLSAATATDNVDATLIITNNAPLTLPLGTTTVTFSATDTAGNTGSAQATVTITDQTRPVITLTGVATVSIEQGSTYNDAGATAFDNVDGNISANIIPSSTVSTSVVGTYTVTYNVSDAAGNAALPVVRTVNVTADVTKPVITLLGSNPVSIELGTAYVDAGATATDNIDGPLVVTTSNPVNISLVGIYTVTYDATDAAGNPADQVTRTVNVTADVTRPVITLLGSNPVSIELGTAYVDAGATAIDNIDGPLVVTTSNPVNINLVGIYTVTYDATDAAGNPADQVTRTVNVTADVTKPVITLLGSNPVSIELGTAYVDAGATATDNIDGPLVVTTSNPVNVDIEGVYTVTYNATDAAGNPAVQVTRTVNVTADVTRPVITLLGSNPVSIELGTAYVDAGATAIDNIDGPLTVTTNNPVNINLVGIYTVTYDATDAAGNPADQVTRTVNVTADITKPVITLLGSNPVSIELGTAYVDAGATALDNIDGPLVVTTSNPVNVNIEGVYTVTYNATDAAGNPADQVTRTVNVTADITKPVITLLGSNPVSIELGTAYVDAGATAIDNIDGPLVVTTSNPVNVDIEGLYTVTYNATDAAGNPADQVTRTVNVTADVTKPVITLLGSNPVSIELGTAYVDAGATATDNIDGPLTVTISNPVNVDIEGVYTVTYNATDAAGNTAVQVSRTVNVTADATIPVVTAPANITVAATDANGTAASVAAIASFLNAATATDNVDTTLTITNNAPATLPLGTTTVTFSATDTAGNTGSAQATVTIADQTKPIITLSGASSMTINVGDVFTDPGATASDNVDGDISSIIQVGGIVDASTVGLYTLTYNVNDAATNAAVQVTRSVSVQDGSAPVVTAPANITVAATDANGTAATDVAISLFLSSASAIDTVDGVINTISHDAPPVFPLGTTTVTFSATDSANNTGQVQATVTVTDQTKPVITLVGAATVSIEQGSTYNDEGATASDNVDGNISANIITSSTVDINTVGIYTVTYNVSDIALNAATAVVRTVTVTADVTKPVVTAPANITVAATDANGTAASVAAIASFLNAATTTDNVDTTLTITNNAPLTLPLGTTTVTFSATDKAGNIGTAQATITITDQTKPVILLNGSASISIGQGSSYSDEGATASDNVDGDITASITTSSNVDTTVPGIYTVTYNVSDVALNAASAVVRTVTVTADATVPVVTAPANITVAATDANGTTASDAAIASFLSAATATDNVDTTLTITNNAPVTFPLGNTTVIFSATDIAGNTGSAQAIVTVTDQTKPVVTLTGASSMTINVGDVFTDPGATANDNVDGDISSIIQVGGIVDASTVGLYTLTYNVSDAATNAAVQVTRSVSVQDGSAPVVTAPANITVAATDANGTVATDVAISLFLSSASAIDTVDGVINTISHDAPPVFPLGTTTVTFSATDSANNTGQVQATVMVTDQTKPVVTLTGASSMTINVGDVFTDPGATASDNVDGDISSIIQVGGIVDASTVGLYTLTYNVSDAATNAAVQVTRSVSVQDGSAPVVTAPANITVAATDANGTAATDVAISLFLSSASAIDTVDGVINTISHDAPPVFPLGTTTVTFSATDSANNTGQVQATVMVTDQSAPEITLLGSHQVSIELGSNYGDAGATALDNVDGNVTNSITPTSTVNTNTIGSYTVTYNVSDEAGNAATPVIRAVSVTADVTKPVITLLGSASVSIELGTGYVDDGATALDNIDGNITSSITSTSTVNANAIGAYMVTYTVSDLAGNAATPVVRTVNVTADITRPVITLLGSTPVSIELGSTYIDDGAIASDDVDGDISASIISTSTVNPNAIGSYTVNYNISDAAGNVATPVVRTVNVIDSTPPVITLPPDIIIDAKGLLTNVDKNPVAIAIDDQDGPVLVIPNRKGPFAPGRHEIIWSATDSSGNTATAIQLIDVNPLIEFEPGKLAAPGSTVKVRVLLNGNAPEYPVTVGYEIHEAGAVVITDNIVILSGTEGFIDYLVPANILPGGITFTLVSVSSNVVQGPQNSLTLTLVNENVAPVATLEMIQNGVITRLITVDVGPVNVSVTVNDANTTDSHSYDWSMTDNVLLPPNSGLSNFEIDPLALGLTSGIYRLAVTVTDNGSPNLGTAIDLLLAVLDTAPVLTNDDSDGDGLDDITEGIGDSDNDGIPDYLDAINNLAALQGKQGVTNGWLLNTQAGLSIRLGGISLYAANQTANVTAQEIKQHAGKSGSVLPAETIDTLTNTGGYFDFEIYGLSYPGQSVLIVIPQHSVIPDRAVYRKYSVISGWQDFVEDSRNSLFSAPGEAGICPPPGDPAYIPGLNPGHHCVQLMIEDGGPNDTNGKNGVISDPGGVAVAAAVTDPVVVDPGTVDTTVVNDVSSGGGGGGSIDLITLILFISLGLYRRNLLTSGIRVDKVF